MRPLFRSTHGWIAGTVMSLSFVVFGCSEDLVDPESPLFDRPAYLDDVEVTVTEPDSATQDTTLFVDVLGDGFDDGSTVEFMVDDTVAQKLKVRNVNYVNKKKLTVELEVDAAAELLSYDVHVTTRRGPKGIGTELFRVVEKTRPNQEFTVTDFTVEQVFLPDSTERCPDTTQPCNKLTLSYTGNVDYVGFEAGIDWDGRYYEDTLEYAYRVPGIWFRGATGRLYPNGSNTITAYWQGQYRALVNWECVYVDAGCDAWGPVEYLVNRGETRYVFMINFSVDGRDYTGLRPRDKVAHAYYEGPDSARYAFPVVDNAEVLVARGSKKNPQTLTLRFEAKAFSDPSIHNGSTTLVAWPTLVMTPPNGPQFVPSTQSLGFDSDDLDIWKHAYVVPNVVEGCYTVEVIGLVTDTFEGHNEDRFATWDRSEVKVGMRVSGQVVEITAGGCGS